MDATKGQSFTGNTVELDGKEFTNCTFSDCDIFYSGGPFKWTNSKATGCRLTLIGSASHTAEFLRLFGLTNPDADWKGVKLV